MERNYEELRAAVIDMAAEAWRFRGVFMRVLAKLDAGDDAKYMGQFNWFMKKTETALDRARLRVVNLEGQKYDIGMAVTPMNIDDFEPEDELYVQQMFEPIIMEEGAVIRQGSVMLGRCEI